MHETCPATVHDTRREPPVTLPNDAGRGDKSLTIRRLVRVDFNTRVRIQNLRIPFRSLTNPWRMLPSFLVIGAQRCGTTSLYDYLCAHPQIRPALRKETLYFTKYFDRGSGWYRACFPIGPRHAGEITGEATPYYLCHPAAPDRVVASLPDVKLIALLRNPVDRAFSQFRHMSQRERESLPFDAVVDLATATPYEAMERIAVRQMERGDSEAPDRARRANLLYYGTYARHLKRWMRVFPRERLLVLRSDELFSKPQETVNRAVEFLGLPTHELKSFAVGSKGEIPGEMSPEARRKLTGFFAPFNEELRELLNLDHLW